MSNISDDELIAKYYVPYLESPFKETKKKLENQVLAIYATNPEYYTSLKKRELYNRTVRKIKGKVLRRLYYGYLKFDYVSSLQTNSAIGQNYKNQSQNALNQFNQYKTQNNITDDDMEKNEAVLDFLILIQRDINNLKKNNITDNNRLTNINKDLLATKRPSGVTDAQLLRERDRLIQKINNDSALLNSIQPFFNTKLTENPSISLSVVEQKANDANYAIQEYYQEEEKRENYQCFGIC